MAILYSERVAQMEFCRLSEWDRDVVIKGAGLDEDHKECLGFIIGGLTCDEIMKSLKIQERKLREMRRKIKSSLICSTAELVFRGWERIPCDRHDFRVSDWLEWKKSPLPVGLRKEKRNESRPF